MMLENQNNIPPQQSTSKKGIIEHVAEIFSLIFTPLLAPTYGVVISLNYTFIIGASPLSARILATISTLAITCMIPIIAIAILYKLGKISDPGVNEQKDRFIPYLVTIACYIACAMYLDYINAPKWIPMFMIGGGLAALSSVLINFKWKISAHGAGMGGLLALIFSIWMHGYNFFDYMPFASIALLATGIVGSARLILRRHTLGQVIAGTLNGFFWVFILTI